MLYGGSLSLEFAGVDLAACPGTGVAAAVPRAGRHVWRDRGGIPPVLLLGFAIVRSQSETVLGMSSFAVRS